MQNPRVVITLTLEEDGRFGVSGFPVDKILTYGMSKMAEKSIDEFFEQQGKQEVIQKPHIHRVH